MPESFSMLVSRKPVKDYVVACLTLFHGGANEVSVKARGCAISKAVSAVETLRRRLQFQSKKRPTPLNVSTIEITLVR